jgi:hypothetical protein
MHNQIWYFCVIFVSMFASSFCHYKRNIKATTFSSHNIQHLFVPRCPCPCPCPCPCIFRRIAKVTFSFTKFRRTTKHIHNKTSYKSHSFSHSLSLLSGATQPFWHSHIFLSLQISVFIVKVKLLQFFSFNHLVLLEVCKSAQNLWPADSTEQPPKPHP